MVKWQIGSILPLFFADRENIMSTTQTSSQPALRIQMEFQPVVLKDLDCKSEVRPSKPGESVIYRSCEHDYTHCANQLCIKKLV